MPDPSRFVVTVDDENREVAPHTPWTALAFREEEWPGAAPDAFARGYGATPAEALRGLANHFDRMYIENHRDAIHEGVSSALKQLDGSLTASVTLLTGLSAEELDALGGIDESR